MCRETVDQESTPLLSPSHEEQEKETDETSSFLSCFLWKRFPITSWLYFSALLSLSLGVFALVCDSEVRYNGYLAKPICRPLSLHLNRIEDGVDEFGVPEGPKSNLTVLFAFSLIVASTLTYLGYAFQKSSGDDSNVIRKGDANMKLWCVMLVLLPSLWVMISGTLNFDVERLRRAEPNEEFDAAVITMVSMAKPAGTASIVAMGFFLIPVSKQSPLLVALGISPIHGLRIHVWAGRICAFFLSIHAIIYCLIFGMIGMSKQTERHTCGFLLSISKFLTPPQRCMDMTGVMSFKNTPYRTTTLSVMQGRGEGDEKRSFSCYFYLRNFTGLLSALLLATIYITSLNTIRRKFYRFFYISHIVFGWLMLLFAITHFDYIALYLMPSILYYLCSQSPMVVQAAASLYLDRGVRMEESTVIADSNGCAEMLFSQTSAASVVEESQAAPYVRICVPSISLLWYPFTVASRKDDKGKLRLLFRKYGYFTTQLWNRLYDDKEPEPPIVLVDAFYTGPDWVSSALKHDVVLMIAGGVGVTPFLSFAHMIIDRINALGNTRLTELPLQRIIFAWCSRDDGLTRHIFKSHLFPLLKGARLLAANEVSQVDFEIVVYNTSRQQGDTQPFHFGPTIRSSPERRHWQIVVDEEVSSPCERRRKYTFGPGAPMRQSTLSTISSSVYTSAMAGAVFFIVASVGLLVHWSYYDKFVYEYPIAVAFRAYGLFMIAAMTLLFGILLEFVSRVIIYKNDNRDHLPAPFGANINPDVEQNVIPEALLPTESPMDAQIGKVSLQLSIQYGRPIFDNLLSPVIKAEKPAVFQCGPEGLLRTVRDCIETERRSARKSLSNASKCAFYTESFEM